MATTASGLLLQIGTERVEIGLDLGDPSELDAEFALYGFELLSHTADHFERGVLPRRARLPALPTLPCLPRLPPLAPFTALSTQTTAALETSWTARRVRSWHTRDAVTTLGRGQGAGAGLDEPGALCRGGRRSSGRRRGYDARGYRSLAVARGAWHTSGMADPAPALKWDQQRRAREEIVARAREVRADTRNHRHVAALRRALRQKLQDEGNRFAA